MHKIELVFPEYEEYQLLDIKDDGFVSLMNDLGQTREDLRLPSKTGFSGELHQKIVRGFEKGAEMSVKVLRVCDEEGIVKA